MHLLSLLGGLCYLLLDVSCTFIADKARDRSTGEVVALKKVRMERERDGTMPTLVLTQLCCWKNAWLFDNTTNQLWYLH